MATARTIVQVNILLDRREAVSLRTLLQRFIHAATRMDDRPDTVIMEKIGTEALADVQKIMFALHQAEQRFNDDDEDDDDG